MHPQANRSQQSSHASYQSLVKVLQQSTWIDDRKFLESCVQDRAEQVNINHPAYGTWTADFRLRKNESSAFLGKYLNDPRLPWRHKRREMIGLSGMILVAKWLATMNLTVIRCRLQIMQNGTRPTRCEHRNFAGRDVWAHLCWKLYVLESFSFDS